jgi:inhibitor of KinA sporulation pathway (predicted exonuclease)
MEIIEIGAVLLESFAGPAAKEFASFVRPAVEPTLSDFCTRLTHIRQQDVDSADGFRSVFGRFLEWVGGEPFTWCSWGAYDRNQFRTDCQRHGIRFPDPFDRHINLKQEFSALHGVKPMGMKGALGMMKIPLEGTHHRAIDDARNIAKIARIILPAIESASQ